MGNDNRRLNFCFGRRVNRVADLIDVEERSRTRELLTGIMVCTI